MAYEHLSLRGQRKKSQWRDKVYATASRVCLKYGCVGDTSGMKKAVQNLQNLEDRFKEFWPDEDRPSVEYIRKHLRVQDLKWYIHNKIEVDNNVWTPDFLFGVAKHGRITWSKKEFPSLLWTNNVNILKVISTSPFGGGTNHNIEGTYRLRCWSRVPALYLKHSEDTIEFMAGLLSCGNIVEKDGISYARYAGRTIRYIEKWGIPLERKTNFNKKENYVLVSPIWPALFSLKMPKEIADIWMNVEKPCKSRTYCPILWRTYVGDFVKDGIPYLLSRRAVYYYHRCKEGAIKKLDMLRVTTGMVMLDYRVKDMVKIWNTKLQTQYND
jgi:hypothetical protein